jgi:hypothetical protein
VERRSIGDDESGQGAQMTLYEPQAPIKTGYIRALSAHSAAEFNISPGRWQHVWLVAIVPPERWGKMDRNDCHTAWGNFKALISSLHHYKNYACSFLLLGFKKKCSFFIFLS